MKIAINKFLLFLLAVAMLISLAACKPEDEAPQHTHTDFVAELKLDMNSSSLKQEVTVKTFIDGDTTHFNFPGGQFENNVFKARYLAINTPESTGKIEEWGKKASNFTKDKLKDAVSIIIESDDGKWNADSTGGRHLVWVWYKTAETAEYRNLNVEILQNGLAIASNSANNRYGSTCMAAINQAKSEGLFVHSKDKDPDFHYGQAIELTLKELRCNIADYEGAKVAFEGVIIKDDGGEVYIEEYDPENDMYCGISAYYMTAGLPGKALEILSVGNRVRIVGTATEYQGSWQISGLTYSLMNPDNPDNLALISEGHAPAYTPILPDTFVNGKVTATIGDEIMTFDYFDLAVCTSLEMKELTVNSIYTTKSGDDKGAMTLSCTASTGEKISVRTAVLYDADNNVITEEFFAGKTIDVKGLADLYTYDGARDRQIKVFSVNDIFVHP